MFKEWYSKENQSVFHLFGRIGRWFASGVIGEIRDTIYLFPTLKFYFNHSSWYVGFRWLVLKIDIFYENYRKRDEYIMFKKTEKLHYCRYCKHYDPFPYLDYGKCNDVEVYEHECCERFENKHRAILRFSIIKFKRMNKKVFALVSGIVGGVEAIAVAIVSYTAPEHMTEINAAIVIAGTAVLEICNLFNKGE